MLGCGSDSPSEVESEKTQKKDDRTQEQGDSKAQEPDANIEEIVNKLNNVKYSHEAASLYRSLFEAAGKDGLSALKRSRYDSIAIQAAWEEVTLSVPEKEGPGVYHPDKDKLNRFLEFLEERAKVNVPKWWAEIVVDARANRRNNIYPGNPTKTPYHNAGLDFITAPHDTIIKKDGDSYVLKIAKNSIKLPDQILQKSDDGSLYGSFSGYFTSKHCFVAVHNSVGYSHDVACIDRSSGKVVWNAEACGCWWGSATGIHESWVSVTLQKDRVLVFGAASIGLYAHAFQANNGKTIFRFSSGF